MLRRSLGTGVLWVGAIAAALALACSEPDPLPTEPGNGEQTAPPVSTPETSPPVESASPDEGYTLEVPTEYLGDHLVPTDFEASVDALLQASEDDVIAGLPARAKPSVGKLFQPSVESPTQESFWLHVYTDSGIQDAIDWVKYLASKEPIIARFLTPHHDVFGAAFRPAPVVGDASVWIELLHGHTNGCWRTELLVFAQDGLVVLLRNAIEVTSSDSAPLEPGSDGASRCMEADLVASLTDIDSIAHAISERLYLDR